MLRRTASLLSRCRPNSRRQPLVPKKPVVTQIIGSKTPSADVGPRCRITFWSVRKGDMVEAGSFLCLYEWDKWVFRMSAEVSGKVVRIHRRIGVDFTAQDPVIDIRPSSG